MRRGEMLAAIAADKGKGYAARNQGIGDAARRLAGKMGVEQRTVDSLASDGVERIADVPCRADYGEACLLKHAGNIERDEELVFDHEDMRRRHALGTLHGRQAAKQFHLIFGKRSRQSRPLPSDRCLLVTGPEKE